MDLSVDRLVGLVVKACTSRAADPGSIPALGVDIVFRLSHTSNLKIGAPLATLPSAVSHKVNAWAGQHGVSIM